MSLSDIPYIIIGIIFIIYEESKNHLVGKQLRKFKKHMQAIKEAPFLFTKPDYMYPKRKRLFIVTFLAKTQTYLFIIYAIWFVFLLSIIIANMDPMPDDCPVSLKDNLLAIVFTFLISHLIGLIIALIVCRRGVKYASVLCRTPFTLEEMSEVGATTEVERCLVVACYLFVLYDLSNSKIRFKELPRNSFAPVNHQLYHKILQSFDRNSTISPVVRNWCRFIMHKHGVLHTYRKSRNLGATIVTTLNEEEFVIEDDLMYSLLFPDEERLFLPEEKLN